MLSFLSPLPLLFSERRLNISAWGSLFKSCSDYCTGPTLIAWTHRDAVKSWKAPSAPAVHNAWGKKKSKSFSLGRQRACKSKVFYDLLLLYRWDKVAERDTCNNIILNEELKKPHWFSWHHYSTTEFIWMDINASTCCGGKGADMLVFRDDLLTSPLWSDGKPRLPE